MYTCLNTQAIAIHKLILQESFRMKQLAIAIATILH